jgi:small-conductance mechanosensitive channel
VILRVVVRTQPHDGPVVLRELRRRVKKAFEKAGIEIPYRHLKLIRDGEGAA